MWNEWRVEDRSSTLSRPKCCAPNGATANQTHRDQRTTHHTQNAIPQTVRLPTRPTEDPMDPHITHHDMIAQRFFVRGPFKYSDIMDSQILFVG